ncbi:MAG: cyclodeaminase/cyclohydrolase family protein [Phycisphaerales bacterium]|nr:cyclodeaminase/cyclohydrolase family protein [Phycisphaerales bacterium]
MTDTPAPAAGNTHGSIGVQPLGELLGAIASKTPAPGGGAVASAAGALAAALAGMVLAYSRGKKSLAEHADTHAALIEKCSRASGLLLELADADAEAYSELNALQRLGEDDPDREDSLPAAAQRCVDVPLEVQRVCLDLLGAFEALAPIANRWLLSDLKIAAILAEAAVRASACNVAVNTPTLAEAVGTTQAEHASRSSDESCDQARTSLESIEAAIDG